jgi:hypothetical protein
MVGARIALTTFLVLATSCGQAASGTASHQPSQVASASAASAGSGGGRCATAQLQFSFGKLDAATGNRLQTIILTNKMGLSCYLGGYPGVELLDAGGQHLQDAQRSTDSFFGRYAPPNRVDVPSGGATTFDLSWAGIDPCADGVRVQNGAALKVTPPGDYDASTIRAQGPVCPNTLVVHPVGSTPSG